MSPSKHTRNSIKVILQMIDGIVVHLKDEARDTEHSVDDRILFELASSDVKKVKKKIGALFGQRVYRGS